MRYGDLSVRGGSMACANEHCTEYGQLYSATRGDYFWANPADMVLCEDCGEPMRLARRVCSVEFD